MVSVKLAKPWLEYAIGDTVEVDPLRAEWLRENGYEAAAETTIPADNTVNRVTGKDLIFRRAESDVRKARRHEPIPDLEVHPPVVDLLTPNQDPLKD